MMCSCVQMRQDLDAARPASTVKPSPKPAANKENIPAQEGTGFFCPVR